MNVLKVVILWVRVNSAFIIFHQVVANVNESRLEECLSENANFSVTGNEASKPIVSDADRGDLLPLTAPF